MYSNIVISAEFSKEIANFTLPKLVYIYKLTLVNSLHVSQNLGGKSCFQENSIN